MASEKSSSQPVTSTVQEEKAIESPKVDETTVKTSAQNTANPLPTASLPKVSALSLASIKAKRELEASQKANVKHHDELPKEAFTETDMLLHWTKFAEKLSLKGQKIMASYMLMEDPILDGTTIKLNLPNESSKVDFDTNKIELLGYLRGHLHNHDITIDVHVNETVETKYAFTPIEKFEKLKAINPALDLLKRKFDLDI